MIRPGAAILVGCAFTLGAGAARADVPPGACPGPIEAASGPLAGGTETYQPADSKASDNQTKVAILGVIAIIVAAFIQARKG